MPWTSAITLKDSACFARSLLALYVLPQALLLCRQPERILRGIAVVGLAAGLLFAAPVQVEAKISDTQVCLATPASQDTESTSACF
jgi:hypothetical protein